MNFISYLGFMNFNLFDHQVNFFKNFDFLQFISLFMYQVFQ